MAFEALYELVSCGSRSPNVPSYSLTYSDELKIKFQFLEAPENLLNTLSIHGSDDNFCSKDEEFQRFQFSLIQFLGGKPEEPSKFQFQKPGELLAMMSALRTPAKRLETLNFIWKIPATPLWKLLSPISQQETLLQTFVQCFLVRIQSLNCLLE